MLKAKVTEHEYETERRLFGRILLWRDKNRDTKKELISLEDTESKRFWREMSDMNKHVRKLFEDEKENHDKQNHAIAKLSSGAN